MIQPIYTSVSNAKITPCDKKGQIIKSDPIPLLKNNYLGEYRTELEKAKVRKNLGIADGSVIEWGNISGYIEDNADLKEALAYQLPEHLKDVIKEDFSTVKGALEWAIEYLSTFVMDTESITQLKQETANIKQIIQEKESEIYEQIDILSKDIYNNSENIVNIKNSIQEINTQIEKINENLLNIDVDANILAWIKNASSDSIQLTDNSKLEVKISNYENNAITINESGLYVPNLSNEVTTASQHIEQLQTSVQEIIDTYVTKEDLGGEDFNFVKQNSFDQHVEQANNTFDKINQELQRTVKTGEDGHVDTLYVNQISKNTEGNIKITDSFEVTTGVPLDIRTVVKSTEELYKLSPDTAYVGMTVANAGDGNIYMLMDISRISEKGGWKASYESLQIVTCTQEEYEKMTENTNEDYSPKVEGQPFLYRDTYYYIYENEESSQYYVTKKQIEEWLGPKASKTEVNNLKTKFQEHQEEYSLLNTQVVNIINDISNNYSTSNQIAQVYATIEDLTQTNNKFLDYYTSEKINELFVTKESLRGGIEENEDDFVFVTQTQYNKDKELSANEISTKKLILQGQSLTTNDDNILLNNEELSLKKDVPKIVMISGLEYKNLKENLQLDSDTYYYTYDDEITGYITYSNALDTFYTKAQVNEQVSKKLTEFIDKYIVPLQERITILENT